MHKNKEEVLLTGFLQGMPEIMVSQGPTKALIRQFVRDGKLLLILRSHDWDPALIHWCRDWVAIGCGDIVNARSLPLLLSRGLSEEVLLSMTGNLSWGPGDNHIPRNAPPIALTIPFQSNQE